MAASEFMLEEIRAERRPEDLFETVLFLPEGKLRQGEGGLRTQGYFKKGETEKPLITVVTVVYNGGAHLEEAILSVINQSYDNVEYIIIDGGSDDNTLDIIKKYEHVVDYWVSESDRGIYDAMNKALRLCLGTYVGFVNADDYLYRESLGRIASEAVLNSFDYAVGPVDIVDQSGNKMEVNKILEDFDVGNNYIYEMVTHHQSFYVNTAFIKGVGFFDLSFRMRADFDLVTRVVYTSKRFCILRHSIGAFRLGGVSGGYDTFIENLRIMKKNGGSISKIYYVTMLSIVKLFIMKNFSKKAILFLRKIFYSGRYTF